MESNQLTSTKVISISLSFFFFISFSSHHPSILQYFKHPTKHFCVVVFCFYSNFCIQDNMPKREVLLFLAWCELCLCAVLCYPIHLFFLFLVNDPKIWNLLESVFHVLFSVLLSQLIIREFYLLFCALGHYEGLWVFVMYVNESGFMSKVEGRISLEFRAFWFNEFCNFFMKNTFEKKTLSKNYFFLKKTKNKFLVRKVFNDKNSMTFFTFLKS